MGVLCMLLQELRLLNSTNSLCTNIKYMECGSAVVIVVSTIQIHSNIINTIVSRPNNLIQIACYGFMY